MILNREYLMNRIDNDVELLCDLHEIFLEDLPCRREAVTAALQSGDLDELRSAAHAIKGALGNLGGEEAHEAARLLEELARAGTTEGLREAARGARSPGRTAAARIGQARRGARVVRLPPDGWLRHYSAATRS
jgi:HPt (histidine-containing phosphotransfer) domain-containing protein